MDMKFIVLDEFKEELGESKAISQSMEIDSTSCLYNLASHRLDTFICG